jgi:hypothetical protein
MLWPPVKALCLDDALVIAERLVDRHGEVVPTVH